MTAAPRVFAARGRHLRGVGLVWVGLTVLVTTPVFAQPLEWVEQIAGFGTALDDAEWSVVRVHDVRRDVIAVTSDVLTVALDTQGTADETVKLRGVVSRRVMDLGGGACEVACKLVWGGGGNGSYLAAGLALVPEAELDPRAATTALTFELIGVPPGHTIRPSFCLRTSGNVRPLYTAGWPQPRREDRVGVAPRPMHVRLRVSATDSSLWIDGSLRASGAPGFPGRARVLLYVTSHSNYPMREARFEGLSVRQERAPQEAK